MHELGIAEDVLRIVEGVARDNGLLTVQAVALEVGPLSGVDAEALRFALDVLSADTLLAEARIDITVPPLRLRCRLCERVYEPATEDLRCPGCGVARYDMEKGHEMHVTAVTGV